jgi:hypothetical protein
LGWIWPHTGYPNSLAGVDLGKRISVTAGASKLNRSSGAFESKIVLRNKSKPKQTLYGPLSLVVASTTKPGVTLLAPDGFTADGKPYRIVAGSNSSLPPRKNIKGIVLRFDNPSKKPFKARYAVYGLLAPNQPPAASAGADQAILAGQEAILDGSASSDPDGNPLAFRWTLSAAPADSAAALVATDTAAPHLTPDLPGDYTVELVVNDGIVDSAPDAVLIHAAQPEPGNSAPTARISSTATAHKGDTVTLDGGQSSDPEGGDALAYRWTITAPAGSAATLTGSDTAAPSFKADQEGAYEVQLVVNDGKLDSAPATATVAVGNRAPTAKASASPAAVHKGDTVNLDGSQSSDLDGDRLTFRWTLAAPAGSAAALSGATAVTPSFKADRQGDYTARLVVNDGAANSAPVEIKITVANRAPTANAGADQTATVGNPVALNGSGSSDPDQDALTYRWTLTAPAGSTATLTGADTAAPSFVPDKAGDYTARLVVNDGTVDSAPATVKITVTPPPQPMVKITRPQSLITVGATPIEVTGTVNDPEGTLTLNGAPVAVSGGGFTAQVALQEGSNVAVARLVNAKGQEATDSVSVSLDMTPPYITVESVADGTTVFTSPLDISGQVNDIVRGTVAAGQANVTVTVNGDTATAKTGEVSNRSYSAQGVVLSEGQNTIRVDASDAVGNVGHAQITVTYKKPGAKHIELVSGDNQTGAIGTAVAENLKAKVVDGDTPIVGQNVVFRVTQGDGTLGGGTDQAVLVATDADGIAATSFALGTRAGVGNGRAGVFVHGPQADESGLGAGRKRQREHDR